MDEHGSVAGPAALPGILLRALTHFQDAVLVTEAHPVEEPGPRIVYANAAFTAMTGYAEHEVLGRSCRFLQGPETDPAARAAMRAGLEAREPCRVELVNYRKDGSPFWVEVLITPLFDETGELTHFGSVQRDTTQRKAAELRLERLALHAEPTGLLNRLGFERALQDALTSADGQPVAVLLADLSGLRDVNHTLGRSAGDELLVDVAQRLTGLLPGAVVGQVEGGEFVVLVRDASVPGLIGLCERVRRVLVAPVRVAGTEVVPEMSLGVALDRTGDARTLLRDADVARRASREEGRGRYALYEPAMGRAVERRQELDQALRAALARTGELHLAYQPVVGLLDGAVHHAEALLRWDRPGSGPVSPAEVIPVAEASGAVLPLSRWVLGEACRTAAAWQQELPGVGVAVNLSPKQFTAAGVVEDVVTALGPLPPSLLTLEVTEGALLHDPAGAAAQLQRLAERGVRVALDDFGTGYSSLGYLKHLPVSELKVDKTFVDGLPGSCSDRAVVKAVLGMAADLGLVVVAEGVETRAQQEALAELGCGLAQGYLFARPVPAARLPAEAAGARGRARLRP